PHRAAGVVALYAGKFRSVFASSLRGREVGQPEASIASCIPRVASSSASSLSATPACPFTQNHSTWCRAQAIWSRCQRSTFFTGCFAAVFHPFRSQPSTHLVMPFLTYVLSV